MSLRLPAERLALLDETDIVRVRQAVRSHAAKVGLKPIDQTKMMTAASELARNTVVYGGGGSASIEHLEAGGVAGLRVTFEDQGPGIPDIERAMRDGYTSGRGMGLGLGGAKRLVHDFVLESAVGKGTRVIIVRWGR
ncbi:MAG TPA: anti-sigma regulatory factor [Acidiferrobacteraceae bacterium]|nr:anti-sigma regulatory factor [Acidiferrobacteraceae bacterium]